MSTRIQDLVTTNTPFQEPKPTESNSSVNPDLKFGKGAEQTWGEKHAVFEQKLRGSDLDTNTLTGLATNQGRNHRARFGPNWSRRKWGQLLGHHRQVCEWTEATILLTFTAQTKLDGANHHLPPLVHCEHIRASREARNQALSKAMRDICQWDAITVIGVHKTGHIHVHTGVWASEPLSERRFEPVLQAHLNNCGPAKPEGHGAGAIQVRSDSRGLTAELGKNVPGLATRGDNKHGVLSEPLHRQYGACLLDSERYQAVRF